MDSQQVQDNIQRAEAIIGYQFRSRKYIVEALTPPLQHVSVADGYYRLAVVGDCKMDAAIVDAWYLRGASRADWNRTRETLLDNGNLAEVAKETDLVLCRLPDGWSCSDGQSATLLEAVVGAVYFDSGDDMEAVKQVMRALRIIQVVMFSHLDNFDSRFTWFRFVLSPRHAATRTRRLPGYSTKMRPDALALSHSSLDSPLTQHSTLRSHDVDPSINHLVLSPVITPVCFLVPDASDVSKTSNGCVTMANISTSELIRAMRQVDKHQMSVAERSELVSAAQGLILEVERSWDTILRMGWSQPSIPATLCTLIDLKLFERWVASDDEVQSASDLGEMVGCDPALMSMKVANTKFSVIYEVNSPTYASLPQYLKNEGYKNPIGKSPAACAFTLGTKFDGTLFDYFAQNSDVNERFGRCMKGFAGNLTSWVDQYPTEKLLDGLDQVVIVDVGGSTGHDLNAFQQVVAKANVEDGIRLMAHDFFTPQPIKDDGYAPWNGPCACICGTHGMASAKIYLSAIVFQSLPRLLSADDLGPSIIMRYYNEDCTQIQATLRARSFSQPVNRFHLREPWIALRPLLNNVMCDASTVVRRPLSSTEQDVILEYTVREANTVTRARVKVNTATMALTGTAAWYARKKFAFLRRQPRVAYAFLSLFVCDIAGSLGCLATEIYLKSKMTPLPFEIVRDARMHTFKDSLIVRSRELGGHRPHLLRDKNSKLSFSPRQWFTEELPETPSEFRQRSPTSGSSLVCPYPTSLIPKVVIGALVQAEQDRESTMDDGPHYGTDNCQEIDHWSVYQRYGLPGKPKPCMFI
ncbi:hypothetical protein E4T47_02238 [Aureobasidium subglaciale]|nr:hypothetical protein E4T47_02238 [Aureobasidium subglaciale]